MRNCILGLSTAAIVFTTTEVTRAYMLLTEDFEDASGFEIGGGFAHYWGVAPLSGTLDFPSYFLQGGSQSGDIFYGSFAKGRTGDPPPTMTISVPDLAGYTDLLLTVALAAPDGTRWESTHRGKHAQRQPVDHGNNRHNRWFPS
jgi:hypothetical protein